MWTVSFCDCNGFEYCNKCESPCEHDQLCRRCHGWEWYPVKILTWMDMAIVRNALGFGPYRTRRSAWESIES